MRTETITRTLYSAAELREAHPKGFSRALERWQRSTCGDPQWRDEYRDSLKGALDAIGDAPPTIDGPIRVMAWFEHHILAPLRLPYVPIVSGRGAFTEDLTMTRKPRDLTEAEFAAAAAKHGWTKPEFSFLGYWQHASGLHVSALNYPTRREALAGFIAEAEKQAQREAQRQAKRDAKAVRP